MISPISRQQVIKTKRRVLNVAKCEANKSLQMIKSKKLKYDVKNDILNKTDFKPSSLTVK